MLITKEELELDYKSGLSMSEIGKKLGISNTTVFRWMKKFDIQSRPPSQAMLGKKTTPEVALKISNANKGKVFTKEHRQKISESHKGNKNPNFGKKCKIHGKRSWHICPDGKIVSMRSSWESSYADHLTINKIDWQYEPKTFILNDGSAYTPDFYLTQSKEWVEVKGWLTKEHKQKIEKWKEQFPSEIFIFANKEYLISLGINLKQKWITSKPKVVCLQCKDSFYRNYPNQKLCSVQCRNKFVANNGPLPKIEKQKRKYSKSQLGENNNSSKFTFKDIEDIRKMRLDGVPVVEIAKVKNSSPSNIYNICRGDTW